MGNEKMTFKRPNRIVALVTYIIALAALILGMFLPFGNTAATGTDAMLAFQLPGAVDAIVPSLGLAALLGTPKCTYAFGFNPNGWLGSAFDLGSLFVLLYALITLAAIITLIPVIVSAASKKTRKNTALKAASFIEVCAIFVLSVLMFCQLTTMSLGGAGASLTWSWALIAAFGGVLLMLIVQSFFYKKGSGFIKFLLFLLSAIAVLFAVYDVSVFIPELAPHLNVFGMEYTLFNDVSAIIPVTTFFVTAITLPEDAILATILVSALALGLLVFINFLLDAMGLGKRTKRYMLIFNVIRYLLEFLAAALIIILTFCTESATLGFAGIIIAVIALISLIINIIRLAAFKKGKKAKDSKQAKPVEAKPKAVVVDKKEAKAAKPVEAKEEQAVATPVAAQETVEEEPAVLYTPVIYNGPSDDFIKTLSNDQKLEFSRVFLERQNGNLGVIPEYVVSGKNDKFFTSVFIYYARVRDLVSGGLMNKMYEFAHIM